MSLELAGLQKRRNDIAQAMKTMVTTAEKEDRGLTEEERSKWDSMKADIESLDVRMADVTEALDLERSLNETDNPLPVENRSYETDGDGVPSAFKEQRGSKSCDQQKEQEARYHESFCRLLRSVEPGMSGLRTEDQVTLREYFVQESRAMSSGSGAAGGYLVPETMGNQIIETMQAFGGIRQFATVMSTASGESIAYPTNDDTSNLAVIVKESTDAGESDVTFGQAKLGAYKYSTKVVRVPMELLQDSAFSIDAFIARKFGQRLGRGTAKHYATGSGTNEPWGLATASDIGHTAANGTAITYAELLKLKHSVDPAYRGNARWAFNDKFLLLLKELSDVNDRPLWQPAIAAGAPDLIDGNPFVIDQGIDEPAAGKIAAVYGDFSEFVIRDVLGITMMRLYERYAEFGQVGFIAFMRTDSNLMDKAAVKSLQMGTTGYNKK